MEIEGTRASRHWLFCFSSWEGFLHGNSRGFVGVSVKKLSRMPSTDSACARRDCRGVVERVRVSPSAWAPDQAPPSGPVHRHKATCFARITRLQAGLPPGDHEPLPRPRRSWAKDTPEGFGKGGARRVSCGVANPAAPRRGFLPAFGEVKGAVLPDGLLVRRGK